jgi:hypothetical protein
VPEMGGVELCTLARFARACQHRSALSKSRG